MTFHSLLKRLHEFNKRRAGQGILPPVTNSTNIAKISLGRLLYRTNTKKELTSYLGETFVEHVERTKCA